MKMGIFFRRVLQRVLFGLATGGLMLQVGSSCDPQVRTTVLGGFQDLAVTFIDAIFLILSSDGTTTV
jgi:hypothetical protein